MGLTSWTGSPDAPIRRRDVGTAKNYLTQDELSDLNLIVIEASDAEVAAHEALLDKMQEKGPCLFRDE